MLPNLIELTSVRLEELKSHRDHFLAMMEAFGARMRSDSGMGSQVALAHKEEAEILYLSDLRELGPDLIAIAEYYYQSHLSEKPVVTSDPAPYGPRAADKLQQIVEAHSEDLVNAYARIDQMLIESTPYSCGWFVSINILEEGGIPEPLVHVIADHYRALGWGAEPALYTDPEKGQTFASFTSTAVFGLFFWIGPEPNETRLRGTGIRFMKTPPPEAPKLGGIFG